MDIRTLRPAKDFAIRYGVKAVVYGAAGSGKTPIINTAPRPLLVFTEPGMLSMRTSNIPAFPAFTAKAIDEFFDWFFKSTEVKNFDTIAVDSSSQLCEIYLDDIQNGKSKAGNKIHGLNAYGEMTKQVMPKLSGLFYTEQKHVYLIAKEQVMDIDGIAKKRPYYPGRELPIKVPHMYDEILHLGIQNVPGVGQVKAFRCQQSIDVMARDRSGYLSEFEPPDFNLIIQKAMQ